MQERPTGGADAVPNEHVTYVKVAATIQNDDSFQKLFEMIPSFVGWIRPEEPAADRNTLLLYFDEPISCAKAKHIVETYLNTEIISIAEIAEVVFEEHRSRAALSSICS
jgi:hypothetical protein